MALEFGSLGYILTFVANSWLRLSRLQWSEWRDSDVDVRKVTNSTLLIRVGTCGIYTTVRPIKETNYHKGKAETHMAVMKNPQSTAAGWGKHQGSGHTEYCTACMLWLCLFFHQGPTLCATTKLCLTVLESQQITNSTQLIPHCGFLGSQWILPLEQPWKGHSPTSCTGRWQYPIHTTLLRVLATWILQTSGDRDYKAVFLGSLLHYLHGDSGKGTFQKRTEMRNEWLTFKSGYCSEQFAGFLPSWGDKDSFTLLNTLISEPHCAGEE